jgi:acyl dehydratase
LDPFKLLRMPPIETRHRVDPLKVMLYAVGLGASELEFVYEENLKVLPSMAVVLTYPGFFWREPEYGVDWQKVLHAEISATLHASLPVQAELVGRTVLGPIIDKGADKGAIVYQTREIRTIAGDLIATVRNTHFLRGDGGFGGSAEGQLQPHAIPERAPDLIETIATSPHQAQIYRLASGDMNPLHIDPAVAKAAGFDRPILHGMATYGIAGRALVKALGGGDPVRISRIDARLSSPVFPGETIETAIWRESDGRAAFRCRVIERDRVVLNNGYVEFA